MNQSRFVKSKAYFLKKDQIAPNSLIYDIRLSSDALRLLLALNALPETWQPRQSDIAERLGWNDKRFRKAANLCIEYGYMKKTQVRAEQGKFDYNIFEWDLKPSQSSETKCPHNDYEPSAQKPSAVNPSAVNGSYSCSSYEDSLLKEQINSDPEGEGHISSIIHSLDEIEKLKLLEKYNLEDSFLKIILSHDINRICVALQAFEQWKEKKEKACEPLGSFGPAIVSAITKTWIPNITKEDKEAEEEKIKHQNELNMFKRREEASELIAVWDGKLNDDFKISLSDRIVFIGTKNKQCPIDLYSSNSINLIKQFINLAKENKK